VVVIVSINGLIFSLHTPNVFFTNVIGGGGWYLSILSQQLVRESVTGLQKSVIACTKHLIGNKQEILRQAGGSRSPLSSNIAHQQSLRLSKLQGYERPPEV